MMKAIIGFTLHVTAKPAFNSLFDCCYQTMWLFSSVPEDSENDSLMETHGAEALYSTVNSVLQAIWAKDTDALQDGVLLIPQVRQICIIRRPSALKHAF